jgi:hypothetical protein
MAKTYPLPESIFLFVLSGYNLLSGKSLCSSAMSLAIFAARDWHADCRP